EVAKYTRRVTNLAKSMAPVDTGKGRSSITGETRLRGKIIVGRIGTPLHYMRIVHEGRGPVTPKKAQALRFKPKKGRPQQSGSKSNEGGWQFATRVGPAAPNPFFESALEHGQPWRVTKGPV